MIPQNKHNLHVQKKAESMGFHTISELLIHLLSVERKRPEHVAKLLKLSPGTIKNYRNKLGLPRLSEIEPLGEDLPEFEYLDQCKRCSGLILSVFNFKNLKRSERPWWCETCRRKLFGDDKR